MMGTEKVNQNKILMIAFFLECLKPVECMALDRIDVISFTA
jgi:hypothetical protein